MVGLGRFSSKKKFKVKVITVSYINKSFQYLPATILLMKYINASEGDIEESKKLIELSYTLRSKLPNVFINRDPMDSKCQLAFRAA